MSGAKRNEWSEANGMSEASGVRQRLTERSEVNEVKQSETNEAQRNE